MRVFGGRIREWNGMETELRQKIKERGRESSGKKEKEFSNGMEWNRDRIETEIKRKREGEFSKEGRRIFEWNEMEWNGMESELSRSERD